MADKSYQLSIELLAKDMASKVLGGFGKALGGLAVAAGGVAAVIGAGKMLKEFGEMAAEEAVGVQKLQKAVENTGANWGDAAAGIETYLAAETKRIALDDGQGRAVLQSLTEMTGDYTKAMELMPLAADLARAKNMDLSTAAMLVGRVASGNTSILTRYGIVLEKGASSTEALAAIQKRFGGQAETYAKSYAGQMEIFGIQFNNLKETIGAVVLPIMTKVMAAFADIATAAIPVVEALAGQLAPAFESIAWWAESLFYVLTGTGGDIPWDDIVPPWLAGVMFALSDAFAAIRDAAGGFIDILSGAESKVTPLSSALAGMGKPVSEVEQLFRDVAGAIMGLVDEAAPVVAEMGQSFARMGSTVMGVFKQLAPVILQVLGSYIQNVAGIWQTVFPAILSIVQTVMRTVQGVITQVVPVLVRVFQEMAPKVTEAFGIVRGIVNDVVPFVQRLVGEMSQFILSRVGFIVTWVQANLPLILKTVDVVLKTIQSIWNAVWPALQVVVLTVWGVIKNAIDTALKVILGIIKLAMQLITGDWEGAWETFKKIITDALAGVFTIVQTVLGGLATLIGGKVGEFLKLGADLIGGFVKGIKDKTGEVMDAIKALIAKIPEAVRKLLGIASPSKVMIEIGENITGGLTIGIENGTPEAVAAMQKVVSSIAKTLKDLASAFHQMNKVEKTEGGLPNLALWAAALKETLIRVSNALNEALKELTGKALNRAVELSKKAEQLFETLKVFAQVLVALAEVETIPDMAPFGAALKQAIVVTASAILEAAAQLGDKALKAAAKLSDECQDILGLVGPAVTALTALATITAEQLAGADGKWPAVQAQIVAIVTALATIAGTLDMTGYPAAITFSESAGKILTVIGPAVSALASLATITVEEMRTAGQNWSWLATEIIYIVTNLSTIAVKLDQTGYPAAVSFAEAAGKIATMIAPSVAGLTALAGTTAETMRAAGGNWSWLATEIVYVVTNLAAIAVNLDMTGYPAAVAFSEAAGKVVGFIQPAITALVALGAYTAQVGLAAAMTAFEADLLAMVAKLDSIASQAGPISADAIAFSTAVGTAVGYIQPAVNAMVALGGYAAQAGLTVAMAAFETDLKAVVTKLGEIAASLAGEDGIGKASAFSEAATAIKTAIETGLDALSGLGETGTGSAVEALAAFAEAAAASMQRATDAVRTALDSIVASLSSRGSALYQAAYAAGSNIGRGIMAGLRAQITTGSGNTYQSTTNNNATYNITQTGAAQSPNSLRTTVTALQMAGTA